MHHFYSYFSTGCPPNPHFLIDGKQMRDGNILRSVRLLVLSLPGSIHGWASNIYYGVDQVNWELALIENVGTIRCDYPTEKPRIAMSRRGVFLIVKKKFKNVYIDLMGDILKFAIIHPPCLHVCFAHRFHWSRRTSFYRSSSKNNFYWDQKSPKRNLNSVQKLNIDFI